MEALNNSCGMLMDVLTEGAAAITGWGAGTLAGWAKPLAIASRPLEVVLVTSHSGSKFPSHAVWWLAQRVNAVAGKLQGWAEMGPAPLQGSDVVLGALGEARRGQSCPQALGQLPHSIQQNSKKLRQKYKPNKDDALGPKVPRSIPINEADNDSK